MTPDARPTPDAPDIDAPPDAPPTPFTKPEAKPVVISAGTADALQSASPGPGGTFYAAGFRAATLGGVRNVVLVKLTATGALDTTFNTTGIVETPLVTPGGNGDIVVATAPDGKIVVAATITHPTVGFDRDIGVARYNANGTLDTGFGTDGTLRLDLSPGVQLPTTPNVTNLVDAARGIAIDSMNRIYLHAISRGEVPATTPVEYREDVDFTVVRLTAAGAPDTTWGTANSGVFRLDINVGNVSYGATPRGIVVTDTFQVIAGGYLSNVPSVSNGGAQAVMYKLNNTGALANNFATAGVFYEEVLAVQTEVYAFAVHGTELVTAGYGRNSGANNVWVSMRFTGNGTRSMTWGGTTNGVAVVDPTGGQFGNNCRNAVALPGGRSLLVGSSNTNATNATGSDASFAVLDDTGKLDTTAFGDGVYNYELSGSDAFWGTAVSGTNAIAVGFKGRVGDESAANNDDSYAVIIPLPQ